MSSVKHEQQFDKLSVFQKYSKIGDPDGIFLISQCLKNGTTSSQSLMTIAQNEHSKKSKEIELSLLLLELMSLVELSGDIITCCEKLTQNYHKDKDSFCDWFVDEFIVFVMDSEIIDIDNISYDIDSDAYLMSPSSIKTKHAGFRNMLVDFDIISRRSDARYTILQKLDKYIAQPEVRRRITEKQLFAQLQKKKELGNKGEEWVVEYERKRISNPNLSDKIKRISQIDVNAGYDIVSFNDDNSTKYDRFIEVKTYKGNEHFHWSHNEIEKANLMGDQYFIYLVDADCIEYEDYDPKIIQDPIKRIGEDEGWAKRPDSYLVERVVTSKNANNLPIFTNVDESMPAVKRIIEFSPQYKPVEIRTQEVKVYEFASNDKENTKVAEDDTISEGEISYAKTKKGIIMASIKEIMEKKKLEKNGEESDKYLIEQPAGWQAIYRVLVDKKYFEEGKYQAFVDYFSYSSNFRVALKIDAIKKADVDIYEKPLIEWDITKAPQAAAFRKRKAIADEFLKILIKNEEKLKNKHK